MAALAVSLAFPAAGDDGSVAAAPVPDRAAPGWALRLDAREDWRLRQESSPSAEDQKSHLALDLGAVDPSERLAFTGVLDLWWDLDGSLASSPSGLATVWDRRNPWVDVISLSVDLRSRGALRLVRAGRQQTAHGPPVTFDGAYVLARPAGATLDLFAFGGRAVHFFQVTPARVEDWLASAGATWRPLASLRLEADYRLTREKEEPESGAATTSALHGYGLTADWRPGDAVRARVFARGLGERVARAGAAALVSLPWQVALDLRGAVQPTTLRDVSETENPYFATLGESRPYGRASVELSRAFSGAQGALALHAGWQGRKVLEGPEGPFNRSLGRAWLLASGTGLGGTGFFASASVERVADDAALEGDGVWTANGGAGWEGSGVRGELGTQYHRYRYAYYWDAEETADVRSFYASARWKLSRQLAFRASWALDVSDRTVQTVFVGAAQSFE